MKKVITGSLLVVLLASVVSVGSAQVTAKPKLDKAYTLVTKASFFVIGGAGFAGRISEEEKALLMALKAKDARSLLALTQDKNDIARLYGLVGLRYLNHPDHKAIADRLLQSKASVQTMSGCIAGEEKVSDLTHRILKGAYNRVLDSDVERLEKEKRSASKATW